MSIRGIPRGGNTVNRKFKYKYWYPISVDIERGLRKARVAIDRLYLKIWKYLFIFYILLMSLLALGEYTYDRDWKREFIDLDASFTDRLHNWNTEGSPGQDPPNYNSITGSIKRF
jgi:hypothetical protein